MKTFVCTLVAGACLALSATTALAQQTMATVKERGKIIVGVKSDYRPFSFTDPSGTIIGMEPDLVADLGKRLGVPVEFVPVTSANRIQFLQQGKIDLIVATMVILPERKKIIEISEPYYGGSANALTSKSNGFKAWEDLRGKPVCGYQGNIYNRRAVEEFGIHLVALKNAVEALAALKAGNCVAYLDDITTFGALLQDPEWQSYEAPLPQLDFEPWGMGARKDDTEMLNALNSAVADWHKTGFLLSLEKKWKLPPSKFLADESKRASAGQ